MTPRKRTFHGAGNWRAPPAYSLSGEACRVPCGCNGKTCASDRDKDRHRARETHNVSILTQNNERRDHGRHGHDANLYQCPVFLLLALGSPRTALRHRVVSRFCRVQESLPCQALGVCGRHATVCHHDRHPLGPALAECLRHGERWASCG